MKERVVYIVIGMCAETRDSSYNLCAWESEEAAQEHVTWLIQHPRRDPRTGSKLHSRYYVEAVKYA